VPHPGAGDTDFLKDLNPDSKKAVTRQIEPALKEAKASSNFNSSATVISSPTASTPRPAYRKFNARRHAQGFLSK